MYFGLLNTDIVNSFSQCVSGDFAVGSIDGGTIINNEIAFQYEKVMNALSDEALHYLERISGEVALVDDANDFTPALYADSSTLRGYIVYKGYSPCPGQSLESTDMCWENWNSTQLNVTTASISTTGSNNYHLNDVFDYKTQNLVLYYDVDQTNLVMASLKTLLRDLVCHSLGSRLFPVGQSDVWSIVSYYGESAERMLKLLEDGMLPSELKKLRLLNKSSGIKSVKLVRG
jgi:hypothetical protein